jgi:hypothetical protein
MREAYRLDLVEKSTNIKFILQSSTDSSSDENCTYVPVVAASLWHPHAQAQNRMKDRWQGNLMSKGILKILEIFGRRYWEGRRMHDCEYCWNDEDFVRRGALKEWWGFREEGDAKGMMGPWQWEMLRGEKRKEERLAEAEGQGHKGRHKETENN